MITCLRMGADGKSNVQFFNSTKAVVFNIIVNLSSRRLLLEFDWFVPLTSMFTICSHQHPSRVYWKIVLTTYVNLSSADPVDMGLVPIM